MINNDQILSAPIAISGCECSDKSTVSGEVLNLVKGYGPAAATIKYKKTFFKNNSLKIMPKISFQKIYTKIVASIYRE